MNKVLNSKFYILCLILIIAAFLRLYNITQTPPGLYPDEAMNGNNALEALSKLPSLDGFKIFYPENNGREGLFMNIQAVFLKFLMPLSGDYPEPWMLRLASALFGILTVLGLYFLAKELFNEKIALLSSFLLAVSFWHINFSRIGFRAIMAPFFAVWAIYFLLRALRSQKYILNSLIGGMFLGLGFYSYIAFRAMPALVIVIWLIYLFKEPLSRKKIILSALIFTSMAIIIFAPLGIYFVKNPQDFFGRTTQVSIFSAQGGSASGGSSLLILKNLGMNIIKTAGMFNVSGDFNWRHNYAGKPELFWPVGIMFIIGIIFGLYNIFKKKNDVVSAPPPAEESAQLETDTKVSSFAFWVLFLWLIIAALPVVVSNEGIPHALRSILLIPPAIILAGFGGIWLYEFIKAKTSIKRFILNASCFIILFLLLFEAYYTYFVLWSRNTNTFDAFSGDYVIMADGLNALPKALPKYVVVEAQGVDVRGLPMPTQTVMFITDTFTPEKQKEKNIYYVLPNQTSQIPEGSYMIVLK